MEKLVKSDGTIDFGIYNHNVNSINYVDYNLESPMGRKVSRFFKYLRFKQFNFIGILGPQIMVGLAVIDLKYLTSGFFYIFDRKADLIIETKSIAPFFSGAIKSDPNVMDSMFSFGRLNISIKKNSIIAKGKGIDLNVKLDDNHSEPLRICTRSGYRGWTYTQKTAPIPVTGQISINGNTWPVSSPDYMALMDWSAGFMRRNTYWNWAAAAATLPDGRSFGLNLAAGTNETGFTENAFWIDNVLTKTDTVNFTFKDKEILTPWSMKSYDGKVDLQFHPDAKREEKTNAVVVGTRFTQLMGRYHGTVTTDLGEKICISDIPGFAEDHYAHW